MAKLYPTLGYLIAIEALLCFAALPRAKFIQMMLLYVLATCFGTAISILGMWSALQARYHTTPPNTPPGLTYNASASAVCGVWLFFNILFMSAMRSAYPQFNFPTIGYNILVNVAFVYGPDFTSNTEMLLFIRRLLTSILTGYGVATGVHFLIYPTNARGNVFMATKGILGAVSGQMKAQIYYMHGFDTSDPFSHHFPHPPKKPTLLERVRFWDKPQIQPQGPVHFLQDEAADLKSKSATMSALLGKLYAELPFAKREFAIGKLSANDLQELYRLLREVAQPLLGLSGIVEIFERVSTVQSWDHIFHEDESHPISQIEALERTKESFEEWREIVSHALPPPTSIMKLTKPNRCAPCCCHSNAPPKPSKKPCRTS